MSNTEPTTNAPRELDELDQELAELGIVEGSYPDEDEAPTAEVTTLVNEESPE
jgi:hypothetical protein